MNEPTETPGPGARATPAPVRQRVRIALPPADAFELFTSGLARWWPLHSHSCTGERDARVVVEPRVGGRVIERGHDGRDHPWGTVTEWQPPRAFAMTWHPGQDPARATQLGVRFEPCEGGCELSLLHEGWSARGDEAERMRDNYAEGWPRVLQPLVDLAAAGG